MRSKTGVILITYYTLSQKKTSNWWGSFLIVYDDAVPLSLLKGNSCLARKLPASISRIRIWRLTRTLWRDTAIFFYWSFSWLKLMTKYSNLQTPLCSNLSVLSVGVEGMRMPNHEVNFLLYKMTITTICIKMPVLLWSINAYSCCLNNRTRCLSFYDLKEVP